MITLRLRFPGGRYHATPWGSHVNEGLVEWPPSPWRMLRALISVGYTRLGWSDVPAEGRALIEALASALPTYVVPPAVATHSRHYMPIGGLGKNGLEKTTLVFDAWAQVGSGSLAVRWPVDVGVRELDLLRKLTLHLGYLGRSESWVDAEVLGPEGAVPEGLAVMPSEGTTRPGAGWEQVSLLAPETPAAYASWQAEVAGNASSQDAPADLVGCLQTDTRTLQTAGWSQPPGSRRVLYWRRADALEGASPAPRFRRVAAPPVEMMLLALATPSRNRHALPPVTETIRVSNTLHVSCAHHARGACESLLGRLDGVPLSGHRHAHVLPLDADGDGHLDHVVVWAPMGLSADAQETVRRVRRLYGRKRAEFDVAVAGLGDVESLDAAWLKGLVARAGARTWVSATPFVAPRHVHQRGKDTIEGQIQAELASRGHPAASEITLLDPHAREFLRFRHYALQRDKHKGPPARLGLALRIRFDAPVTGPLCLGYASHFGIGRFRALD